MTEINIFGLQLPSLLLLAGFALVCTWAIRRPLASLGAYRWIWHPPLFDLALYILVLYILAWFPGASTLL